MDFKTLPKVELHLHLDCSLSYRVVKKIKPSVTESQYKSDFIAPSKCTNLADYINRAASAIDIMQTEEQLRLVVFDLFEQLKADNNIYTEIRFAPLLHTEEALDGEAVVEIVNDAVNKASVKFEIEAGIILCTLRHFNKEQSLQTAKMVERFKGTRVCALDIASDEAGYGLENHVQAFQYAHQAGCSCTAHAGEACGPESVWETLDKLKPSRIGHGIRSIEDAELIKHLKEHQVHLEVCPTSNVQTNVYDKIEDHRADDLYNSGVSMGINTDGRALSNVNLTEEYRTLHRLFGWDAQHFLKCNLNAIQAAFTSDRTKQKIAGRLRGAYKNYK